MTNTSYQVQIQKLKFRISNQISYLDHLYYR